MNTELFGILVRAMARLGSPTRVGKPGSGYNPAALVLVRWLAMKPGSPMAVLVAAHETSKDTMTKRLNTLRLLGLAEDLGWRLTPAGEAFRKMIDEEEVI